MLTLEEPWEKKREDEGEKEVEGEVEEGGEGVRERERHT